MNLFRPRHNFFYYLMSPFRWIGRLFSGGLKPGARGKLWWSVIAILVLFKLSASLDAPEHWNRAADWVNKRAEPVSWLRWVKVPHYWSVPFRFGLDLQGGTHLIYEAEVKDIPESERDEAMEGVKDVIERRVNAFGVAEPVVQTNQAGGKHRIIVELAGVSDVRQAIQMIGETPILEFKEENAVSEVPLTSEQEAELKALNALQKKRAEEILRKMIADGAKLDFAVYAKESSDDAATKETGGSLGLLAEDGADPELWKWADTHRGVTLSRTVVETSDAYQIVQVKGRDDSEKEIEASHILICWKDARGCEEELSKEQALKQIQELRPQLTPENFADKAKLYSFEPGADTSAGALGWFGKGRMVKAFEDAAFPMAKGQISEPVESEFGYHLILKKDERPHVRYDISRVQILKKTKADILPPQDPWKNTGLSGKHLKRAQLEFEPNTNEPQVVLEFNDEGKKMFAELTGRNIDKLVAIFLDQQPISIPRVQQAITEGNAVISGSFDYKEAKLLAQRLNAGALPVPIELLSQQTIGASLGQDSLSKSLHAGLIGFLAIVIFMVLYYRLPGLLAAAALCVYTALTLAIFKLWPVTMTLSGIAGVILSIGMAVDANILIFERLKEELRNGRPLESAINEGFKRAWMSIRDSNVASLITCIILYTFTSSSVKGFAVTLALGIFVSMFTAINVTRTLLRFVAPWVSNKLWLFR
jgi:protein-export membrane protein SecD